MSKIARPRPRRPWVIGAVLFLSLGAAWPTSVEAQARRGAEQRQTRPAPQRGGLSERQGEVLLDRFAQRVGQALRLDRATTQRLLRELQRSRLERGRINADVRLLRHELGQRIEESPADEERIGALMDELFALEVERAEVAVDEQARLAGFLTPLQRARVIWLQQQFARRALERGSDRPPVP